MAKSYRPVDRDQPFLLPADMREWLPAEHLVWVVLDVIERVDTGAFHRGRGRRKTSDAVVGRRGYDPDMLLGLLVYAYCVGERSSRGIERRCLTDVAFRVACAQDVPDHSVIARFRARFCEEFGELFTQVLLVCAQAGMVDAGLIALDGTKVQANASVDANKTEERLRLLAQEIVAEAQEADAAEDRAEAVAVGDRRARDMKVRAQLADRQRRARVIEEALDSIETERKERPDRRSQQVQRRLERAVEVEARIRAEVEDRGRVYQEAVAAGKRPTGRPPGPPEEHKRLRSAQDNLAKSRQIAAEHPSTAPVKRRNLTDPGSRLMKTRRGFRQGYNAQIVASEDYIIIHAQAHDEGVDSDLYQPSIEAAQTQLAQLAAAGQERQIGTVVADAGYFSLENITAEGPERIIAFGKAKDLSQAPPKPARTTKPGRSRAALDAAREKFTDPATRRTYKRRGSLIEPINAHLKDRRGLRRFSMRGLDKVNGELQLAAAATNLMRYATRLAT